MVKTSHIAQFLEFAPKELRGLKDVAQSNDLGAVADALNDIVRKKLEQAQRHREENEALVDALVAINARELQAPVRWEADTAALEQGLAAMQEEFEKSSNLPVADFARLASKSEQAIYNAIRLRKLLALDCGRPGKRVPNWQLLPKPLRLTREVLKRAPSVDAWTIYNVLSEPLEILGDMAPVEVAHVGGYEDLADIVLNELGIHE